MQMKKNENGVTLIALAIMVIVMLMIASVTVYSGVISIQESKQKRIKIELETVQHAVLENYTKYKIYNDEKYLVGTPITSENDSKIIDFKFNLVNRNIAFSPNAEKQDKYYWLRSKGDNNYANDDYKMLDLSDITFSYIVCYKTGEVMNIDTKSYINGDPVYTRFN